MSFGTMAVDYEVRVDYNRLRTERLKKVKEQIKRAKLGALLCFDGDNIRYITSTHAPPWSRGKMSRYCILPRNAEPILFEMGSLALARKESHGATWLKGNIRTAVSWGHPKATETLAEQIKEVLIQLSDALNNNDEKTIKECESILNEKGIFGDNYQQFFSYKTYT